MAADGQTAQPIGLRERNKIQKRERIISAARQAFADRGFEGTTLREVAAAADIGTGTLFLYVKTKEDLLVLVFKHELEPVLYGAFADVPKRDLLRQFLHVFRPTIEHHSHNLALSRPFLKDLAWVNEPVASVISEFMAGWFDNLAALVDGAKARGEIRPEIDTRLLAQSSAHLFLAQLRRWVAGWITREELDEVLEASLRLLLTGLEPAQGAKPATKPSAPAKTAKPRRREAR